MSDSILFHSLALNRVLGFESESESRGLESESSGFESESSK